MSSLISQKERVVASFFNRFPRLKSALKYVYYWFFYQIKKPTDSLNLPEKLRTRNFSEKGYDVFFGYYDKSPENKSGDYLLYLKRSKKNLEVYLSVFDLSKNDELLSFKVSAVNNQQGCRQQWINDKEFIFNDYDEKEKILVSKVFNIEKREVVKKYPFPISEVAFNGRLFSVNFKRLFRIVPEYGYFQRDKRLEVLSDKEDGIFEIFEDGSWKLLLSISRICKELYIAPEGNHRINHVMSSPFGEDLIFLYRVVLPNNVQHDRLIHLCLKSLKLSLLSDHQMVSHCFWYDANTIISYMRRNNEGDHYYKVQIDPYQITQLEGGVFGKLSDGHPHVHGQKVIFDTYPQKNRLQNLYYFDKSKEVPVLVGQFFSPLKFFGPQRCDLHPRFNSLGNRVYVDTTFTGQRSLLQLNYDEHFTQGLKEK